MNRCSAEHSRRAFLRTIVASSAGIGLTHSLSSAPNATSDDLSFLRETARQVLGSASIPSGGQIPGGAKNITGRKLRVPGGTLNYYPAFWIRDAAMMLGGDFIPADEIEGWVRVTAATQPGAEGLHFGRLRIPPHSIPDHITLGGEACWFPGAYLEQGNGTYGFLPPADDAFYFTQMIYEHWRQSRKLAFFRSTVKTGWGEQRLADVCVKAFDSVTVDQKLGLVLCDAAEGRTRVDWGFCDAIRKAGLCLMPSLLRLRAALQLAAMSKADGKFAEARRLRAEAGKIQKTLIPTFFHDLPKVDGQTTGCLLSATELGRKDDVWASAFAVWLGVLPRETELKVARHLLALYDAGGTVAEGCVRHLPPTGEFGGHWEKASCPSDHYQNGGYWATPVGWYIVALQRVNSAAADRLLSEYIAHLRANRDQGAPWEWINPALKLRANPLYGSSAGLVYIALTTAARQLHL